MVMAWLYWSLHWDGTADAPFWRLLKSKRSGEPVTGLSFDAEQFWPFIFSRMMGVISLGWEMHTSIVRLDGWDSVERI